MGNRRAILIADRIQIRRRAATQRPFFLAVQTVVDEMKGAEIGPLVRPYMTYFVDVSSMKITVGRPNACTMARRKGKRSLSRQTETLIHLKDTNIAPLPASMQSLLPLWSKSNRPRPTIITPRPQNLSQHPRDLVDNLRATRNVVRQGEMIRVQLLY